MCYITFCSSQPSGYPIKLLIFRPETEELLSVPFSNLPKVTRLANA